MPLSMPLSRYMILLAATFCLLSSPSAGASGQGASPPPIQLAQDGFTPQRPEPDALRERRGMDSHSSLGGDIEGPGGSTGPGSSLGSHGPGGTTGGYDPRAEDPKSPTRSMDLQPRNDIPGLKPGGYDDKKEDSGY
jgi:hypothetical protein